MRTSLVTSLVVLTAAGRASAQAGSGTVARVSAKPGSTEWELRLTPYFWDAAMEGDVSVQGNSQDVNRSYGDAFDSLDHLELGMVFHLEAESGGFSMLTDVNYLAFEDELDGGEEVEVRQEIYELGCAFTIFDEQLARGKTNRLRLDVLGGLRVHEFGAEVEVPSLGVDAQSNRECIDAFFGARARYELGDHLFAFLRGDFGLGESDGAWNAMGGLDVRFNRHFAVELGYRWYSLNFDEGSASRKFVYDLLLHGPVFGMTFTF